MILPSLRFQTMELRFEEVSEAHKNTFQWIYHNERNGRQWDGFSNWLSGDGQVYWVNGKVGSGKSTLMRYIYDYEATTQLLSKWSNGGKVLMAKYFFWNSGSEEQRSQAGLFRCLLYEALNQRRDLIRHVFPEKWTQIRSLCSQLHNEKHTWPLPVLKRALLRLAQKATEDLRICFFVDGLDECEGTEESGDHRAMAESLKEVSSLPFVKICLSSRPWHLFEEIFGQGPGIRLQDLTQHDMSTYVTDKLRENGRMEALERSGSGSAIRFKSEILSKAEGVFLWVTLVIKSVINGIGRYESISDLKDRMLRLPSGLEDLYDHMFTRIDSFDMRKAAQILQIFEIMSPFTSSIIQLGLALEVRYDQAISDTWEEISPKEFVLLYNRTAATLKSSCIGFIETYEYHDRSDPEYALDYVSNEPLRSCHKDMLRSHLSYTHRTVGDYIKRKEIQDRLCLETEPLKDFHPILAGLIASTLLCKILKQEVIKSYVLVIDDVGDMRSDATVRHMCCSWYQLDYKVQIQYHHLFKQLHAFYYNIIRYNRSSLCDNDFVNIVPDKEAQLFENFFFEAAISFGCEFWVMQRLKLIKRFPKTKRPLLVLILGLLPDFSNVKQNIWYGDWNWDLVQFVLQCGGNPNDRWSDKVSYTIWEIILKYSHKLLKDYQYLDHLESMTRFLVTFLEFGADTNPRYAKVDIIIKALEKLKVQGCNELRELYEENKKNKIINTAPSMYRGPCSKEPKRARANSLNEQHQRRTIRQLLNSPIHQTRLVNQEPGPRLSSPRRRFWSHSTMPC